jgi:uncharacterized protein (DUF2336 family)
LIYKHSIQIYLQLTNYEIIIPLNEHAWRRGMAGTQHWRAMAQRLDEELRSGPSATSRTHAASVVAGAFTGAALSDREREIATEILETLARDVELRVREALAEHLKHCAFLPARIARTIASDVAEVAVPFIRYSKALREDDLIEIVIAGDEAKQEAVAQREAVSARLSWHIARHGGKRPNVVLLANPGAEIQADGFQTMLDRFGDAPDLHARMAARARLPISVTARLIQCVSAELRTALVKRHGLSPAIADELAQNGGERALARAVKDEPQAADLDAISGKLKRYGQLTPTLLLRALCEGDLRFFEAALAALADIAPAETRRLLADGGARGERTLFQAAGLPEALFNAFRVALRAVREVKACGDGAWCERHTQLVVSRLVKEYGELSPEGLEHTMSQISHRIVRKPNVVPYVPPRVGKRGKSHYEAARL